mgnify:CR=1 FL=1
MNLTKLLKSEYSKRFIFSTLDQFLLSLINFVLSYLLMRILTKSEYGIYNIVIPVSLIFTAIQNALINTPLMIEYWVRPEDNRERLVSSLLYIQKKYISFFIISLLLFFLLYYILTSDIKSPLFYFSLTLLIIGLLSREFIRNYFFTVEKPLLTLINDFYYFILIIILIFTFYQMNLIRIEFVLLSIGLASFFSSIFKNKSLIKHSRYSETKKDFSDCFKHGKWALLGVIVTHIQSYGYVYLIGIFFSTTDIGDISAIRLIFAPFTFINVGYSKIAIPRGIKLYTQNRSYRFFKEEIYFSIFYSIIIFFFSLIIYLLPKDLIMIFLKNEYKNALEYLPYLSLSAIISVFGATGSNGLQALKKFKSLSKINSIAMIVSFILTIILIFLYGIKGALTANILAQLVNASGMWFLFYKIRIKA